MPILAAFLVALTAPQDKQAYRIDFGKVFYAKPSDEDRDRQAALMAGKKLTSLKGRVAKSASNLLEALQLSDQIYAINSKLNVYHHVQYLLDTRIQEVGGVDIDLNFLDDELGEISPKSESAFFKENPKLVPYRFVIERSRRQHEHELPAHDERLVGGLAGMATDWEPALFEDLRRIDPQHKLDNELQAFTLIRLSKSLNETARLHKFSGATEAYCFSQYLEPGNVKSILDSLAAQRGLLDEVTKLNFDHRARMGANMPPAPTFTIDEATQAVLGAVAPLGDEYSNEMKALLDPANGRIDIAGGPSRSGLGTGWGFPATQPSILYWPEFTGIYDDLDRGLSHEGGHAVHFQLMRKNGVLPAYSEGPGYFFESFAEFNQLLLADYLYQHEKDINRKAFFLSQFVAKAQYPLYLAVYPALEFAIHDGVANGTVKTRDDLNNLEQEMTHRFVSPAATIDKDNPIWRRNETFYTHPLYNINHLMGAVLAIAYFQEFTHDPAKFVPRYLNLMRNGFDDTPANLLRKFVGIDLSDPHLVSSSTDLFRSRLADLRKLYDTQEKMP